MAAASRPGPGDARVPCPMCGGLIHPIAGKCKHCKGDLAGMRTAKQAAAAPLPQIIATEAPRAPNPYANGGAPAPTNGASAYAGNGYANGHANGHRANGYAPAGMHAPLAGASAGAGMARPHEDGMSPVLPPRVSARMAAMPSRGGAWWKSWPLVVIVLAVLAIVTAVILMVWPPGKSAAADTKDPKDLKNAPPVAPERMETNPLPPSQPPAKSGDPWNDQSNNGGSKIDIPDDPDDPDVPGIKPSPNNGGGNGKQKLTGTSALTLEFAMRVCDRAIACGKSAAKFADYCKLTKDLTASAYDLQPPTCAARTRCLAAIDTIDCDGDVEFDMKLIQNIGNKFGDCLLATTSC